MRRSGYATTAALLAAGLAAAGGGASAAVRSTVPPARASLTWSSTWSAPQSTSQAEGFGAQTIRMVVNSSLGGNQVRLRLNNIYSTGTAVFGHVTIGLQQSGSTTQGTPATVTFGGSQSVSLGPGASAWSDATPLTVPAHTRLLVSLFLPPQHSGTAPMHSLGDDTEYNYWGSADISASPTFTVSNTFAYSMYVDDVDVDTLAASTVVAVGDSITDGANLATDTDTRWPDYLAARIAPAGLAVANAGVNGDTVTGSSPGIAARWSRDVLAVPGARAIIDEGGINDLRLGVTATALEAAQTSLIASAHTAGLKILLTTITPCSGASSCTAGFETQRQAYNAWVRAGTTADGFVDFDHAIGNAAALAAAYDSGDHLHPNAAGQDMLANAVDPSLL
jgi:lysophospholipase L1-like esterase